MISMLVSYKNVFYQIGMNICLNWAEQRRYLFVLSGYRVYNCNLKIFTNRNREWRSENCISFSWGVSFYHVNKHIFCLFYANLKVFSIGGDSPEKLYHLWHVCKCRCVLLAIHMKYSWLYKIHLYIFIHSVPIFSFSKDSPAAILPHCQWYGIYTTHCDWYDMQIFLW